MKHALVVDDSKSAQLALKKQLEAHNLRVSLVDSGESALAFLEREPADVIFMDHTMPGMDGLETLAAVKRNPRTAMIPVMMYTTKEGAVYVGQARALGGIDVLPKDVHPQVLFDMLLKLGLVQERRVADTVGENTPRRRIGDVREDDTQKPPYSGAELTALLSRIIADQAALRAEIRYERHELAKATAAEAVAQQVSAAPLVEPDPIDQARPNRSFGFATAAIAIAALIFAIAAWRDVRSSGSTALTAGSSAQTDLNKHVTDLEASRRADRARDDARYMRSLDALQWALNQNATVGFGQLPFGDARVDFVRDLLERLVSLGFRGRVRIESHLGEFCLVNDDTGTYQLAPPDLPIEACTLVGDPLDESSSIMDRQTVAFAEFLRSSPLVRSSGITVELVAHDRAHSLAAVPMPAGIGRAGEWNEFAARNNRLEFSLIPTN